MPQTEVPRNWIPLLPKVERDGSGVVTVRLLARGTMRDPVHDAGIPLAGRIVEPATLLDIFDAEVRRAGARGVGQWTLGPSADARAAARGRAVFASTRPRAGEPRLAAAGTQRGDGQDDSRKPGG